MPLAACLTTQVKWHNAGRSVFLLLVTAESTLCVIDHTCVIKLTIGGPALRRPAVTATERWERCPVVLGGSSLSIFIFLLALSLVQFTHLCCVWLEFYGDRLLILHVRVKKKKKKDGYSCLYHLLEMCSFSLLSSSSCACGKKKQTSLKVYLKHKSENMSCAPLINA